MMSLGQMRSLSGLTLSLVLVVASPAEAKTYVIDFSGTLSSAQNYVSNDPAIPDGDFFRVGQQFSGTIGYDTDSEVDEDLGFLSIPLSVFDIVIDGVDFSERFIPRLLGRDTDGAISFVTGGASQGGGASLRLNLGPFGGTFPTTSQLAGRNALFSYADFQPFGGEVSGQATFAGKITAPVPEPATWALMIAGFGMLGGVFRRRRTQASVTVKYA